MLELSQYSPIQPEPLCPKFLKSQVQNHKFDAEEF